MELDLRSWCDTHCHPPPDGTAAEYVEVARAAGVAYLVVVGADAAESVRAQAFANSAAGIWFSAGIHPHAAEAWDGDLAKFAELALQPRFVAVGEIGLDYYYEHASPVAQRRVLSRFLEFAAPLGRPLILHCRDREGREDAYRDLHAAVAGFLSGGGRAVLHCYTGTIAWAERFLAEGAYFGVAGIVTFPRAGNVRELACLVPLDRLLLETDSPYLAPVPHRGRPNHSGLIPEIARRVAEERGLALAELAAATTGNAQRLFGLAEVAHG